MEPIYLNAEDLITIVDSEWLLDIADDNRDGIADAEIISQALVEAEAEIEAHLSARYELPFVAEVPGILTKAGLVLALESLASRRPEIAVSEILQSRIKQARALLYALSNGQLALPSNLARSRSNSTTLEEASPLRRGGLDSF